MVDSVLVIDLGKTACRAALWSGSHHTDAEGEGAPGLAARTGAAGAEAAILAVVAPLLRAAGLALVGAVGVGAVGALAAPDAARDLAERLCTSLPARAVAVMSDAVASHAGALGGEPGVVLAVGTGAVAIAVGPDGTMHRADGWGSWLGDEGGGAWLGLHGLRAAVRTLDGRGPETALQAMAEARFGPLPAFVARLEDHESPPRLAASFARDVAHAAQMGDEVAARLLQQAATALAETVHAAASRLTGPKPIRLAVVGGLAALGSIFNVPLLDALGRCTPLIESIAACGTALDGVRMLALSVSALHERHVVRVVAPGAKHGATAKAGGIVMGQVVR